MKNIDDDNKRQEMGFLPPRNAGDSCQTTLNYNSRASSNNLDGIHGIMPKRLGIWLVFYLVLMLICNFCYRFFIS